MPKLRSFLLGTAAGIGLIAGVAPTASAQAPVFTLDPTALPQPFAAYTGNQINSSLTTGLINWTSPTTATESGVIKLSSASNSLTFTTNTLGLNSTYQMYLTFSASVTYIPGTGTGSGTAGSQYTINSLNFTWWYDPNKDTTFTGASIGSAPTVTQNTADITMASGTIIPSVSSATIQTASSLQLSAVENFFICSTMGNATLGGVSVPDANCTTAGIPLFFEQPSPFFSLALDVSESTGGQLTANYTLGTIPVAGDQIAVTGGTSNITFEKVPEPAPIALFASGLLGLGWLARRRRKTT